MLLNFSQWWLFKQWSSRVWHHTVLYRDINEYVASQMQSTETNTITYIWTLYSILKFTFHAHYTYMHETKNSHHMYSVKLSSPFYVHDERKFSGQAKFVLAPLSGILIGLQGERPRNQFYLCGVHPVALFTYTIWTYNIYIYICNPQSQLFYFVCYLTTWRWPAGTETCSEVTDEIKELRLRITYIYYMFI
jgi:hypothetical protein